MDHLCMSSSKYSLHGDTKSSSPRKWPMINLRNFYCLPHKTMFHFLKAITDVFFLPFTVHLSWKTHEELPVGLVFETIIAQINILKIWDTVLLEFFSSCKIFHPIPDANGCWDIGFESLAGKGFLNQKGNDLLKITIWDHKKQQ